MAKRELYVEIDLIGKPQYRRLVEFLVAVEDYARVTADEDLSELAQTARDDLAAML